MPAGCREWDRDILAWCQLVKALELEAKDGQAVLRLDLRPFAVLDLVRLLVRWPAGARNVIGALPRER